MKNKYMCKCTETEHIANEREKTMTEKEKKSCTCFVLHGTKPLSTKKSK